MPKLRGFDDDDIVSMVAENGGEMSWPKDGRRHGMPPEGQMKRLVKEGRLWGATVTVSPWQKSTTGGVFIQVGIPLDNENEID